MKTISNTLFYGVILLTIILPSCKEKEVPVVSTSPIVNVTGTTATSGGEIIDEGSSTITARGVCWSTGNKPTIKDNITSDGAGAGTFVSNIPNLTPVTTYFVRAYATNSVGTGYGMAMSFTTMGQVPTATTNDATNLTVSSATLNGTVNANYLSTTVTFEYGTATTYGQTITALQSPVTGNSSTNVTAGLTGLAAGTTYHFRVKTVNSLGTSTGNDKTFTTLGQAPTATTQPVNIVTTSGATLSGMVNANYLSTTVTFEYGTSTSYGSSIPATPGTITGSSNTNVFADIMGLTAGTTYHFRLKAENSLGITYSTNRTFRTMGDKPIAVTQAASNPSATGATLNGVVNANYISTSVTFEYGLSTSYGTTISAAPSTVTGNTNTSVAVAISGLTTGTTYHFRVVATNSLGTTYGSDMSFTTVSNVVDVDGNSYKIVAIGTQVWMAENLKTTKFNDGNTIPLVTNDQSWIILTTPGYCFYNNDESTYKPVYGALYNWYAVNSGELCPTGWHIPLDTEWSTLTTYLGGESVAGGKLKEQGTVHWQSPNNGATNESGFTGLPGGYRDLNGAFSAIGQYGEWWTSTGSSDAAWDRHLVNDITSIVRSSNDKNDGFSVRCIKD